MRRKHTPDLPNACPICSPARCTKASGRGTIRGTKRKIGYIDCTPTWVSLVPVMVQNLRDPDQMGSPGQAGILSELKRMAQAADNFNRQLKKLKERGIK